MNQINQFSLFLFILSISTILCFCSAQQKYSSRHNACSGTNYTSNTPYHTNLKTLIQTLTSNSAIDGALFNSTSIGRGADTVNGQYLCRGDATTQQCNDCVKAAAPNLVDNLCRNQIGAITWYDFCMFRYTNESILGRMEEGPGTELRGLARKSDLGAFNSTLDELLIGLVENALKNPSAFAAGDRKVVNFDRVYGMVQCTPDIGRSDCEKCLTDGVEKIPGCCSGIGGVTILRPSCVVRYEPVLFFDPSRNGSAPPASPPPPPPPPTTNGNGTTSPGSSVNIAAVATPTVIGAIFIIAVIVYLLMIRKRKKKAKTSNTDHEMGNGESLQFDLDMIKVATDEFSTANKLGEGGFGAVYKGVLVDGQEIAVKRLSVNSGQGSEEFKNEVVLLNKLQHRNLVRLLGFCLEEGEKLLIYEFVPNRSLDKYLFDAAKKAHLNWERRYKIIGGIARGLLYLHEDSRLRIIHRDLKAGNILLDGDMNAKISDFGMAKLVVVDQTHGNTSRIAGTLGYMAPEYALHGLFSVKSDVFSFGVLLLEIISGQKTTNFNQSGPSRDLLSHAWKLWREGTTLDLVDLSLMENYSSNEVIRCIHIGLLCVQENADDRPTMSTVVLMLNSFSLTLPAPSVPAFSTQTRTGERWEFDLDYTTTTTSPFDQEAVLLEGRHHQ